MVNKLKGTFITNCIKKIEVLYNHDQNIVWMCNTEYRHYYHALFQRFHKAAKKVTTLRQKVNQLFKLQSSTQVTLCWNTLHQLTGKSLHQLTDQVKHTPSTDRYITPSTDRSGETLHQLTDQMKHISSTTGETLSINWQVITPSTDRSSETHSINWRVYHPINWQMKHSRQLTDQVKHTLSTDRWNRLHQLTDKTHSIN